MKYLAIICTFLLAIPAVLASGLYEATKIGSDDNVQWGQTILATIIADMEASRLDHTTLSAHSIALDQARLTRTGQWAGTLLYMAHEQFNAPKAIDEMSSTRKRKLVPQRGWAGEYFWMASMVSGSPCS